MKKNPNRILFSPAAIDTDAIVAETTSNMVLHCWACVIGAIMDFSDTTTNSILRLWNDANKYSLSVSQSANATWNAELKTVEKMVGLKPVSVPNPHSIRSVGDFNRFKRRVNQKALYSGLALMMKPLIDAGYSDEYLRCVVDKAYGIDESILKNQLSIAEINEALADEYRLMLVQENGMTHIVELSK